LGPNKLTLFEGVRYHQGAARRIITSHKELRVPGTASANGGVAELILSAGPVAKFVLILLAAFSIICWALIVEKWWEFHRIRRDSARFLRVFREARRFSVVYTAAKKHGARGFGVDLDRRLVQLANRLAARAGVADRAVFYERDLYDTDLSAASVVTIYLLPEVNLMVRPKLLATLKAGTRIVSHDYDMGDWPPDLRFEMDAPGKTVGRDQRSKVFYWVVPGNAAGKWRWRLTRNGVSEEHVLSVTQNFQMLQGSLMVGEQRYALRDAKLTGEEIAFEAVDAGGTARYRFSGRITRHALTGSVYLPGGSELPWNGTRTELGAPAHAALKKPELRDLMPPEK
jgi:hypothetical protein